MPCLYKHSIEKVLFCDCKAVLYFSSTVILDEITFKTLNIRVCSFIEGKNNGNVAISEM